jgi:hypothetical protein
MKGEQAMSISINSNLNNYDYQKYLNATQGNVSNQQNTYKDLLSDYLKLSNEGMQQYTGDQSTQFLPTGNYSPTASEPDLNLTIDQKKAFLTNLQTKLNGAGSASSPSSPASSPSSASTTTDQVAAARAAAQADLTNFNASTASDDQVNSLFKQVTDTFASAHPHRGKHHMHAQNQANPLSLGTNNVDQTSSNLTVDDMKTFLTNLMSNMDNLSSDGSGNTTSSQNPLDLSFADQQSGFNTSSASDDQIQSLFAQMTAALNNSQTQGQDTTSLQQNSSDTGLPPILQASGAALPPFNWKPTATL